MTNKELIEKLQAYFLKQDPKVVTRILANMFIDVNRVFHYDSLSDQELISLHSRMALNHNELQTFALDENPEPLKYFNVVKHD